MNLKKKTYNKIALVIGFSSLLMVVNWITNPAQLSANPQGNNPLDYEVEKFPIDSPDIDLPFPFKDGIGGPGTGKRSGLFLKNPSNITTGFEYDPETGTYNYSEKIGDNYFKYPTYMDFDEYINYDSKQSLQDYWKQKSEAADLEETKGFRPKLTVKGEAFDRIFGGNVIDIRPQGSAELSFGINRSTRDNPALPANQRSTTTFDFDQQIQLNVVGNIGEKLKISTSYNTEATFDFENQMKIEYTGYDDEIIQKIEAGNVSLPLKGQLITGSQTLNECDGFSVTVGTNTYNSTGIYTDILLAADGCDSTVTTDLTIRPVSIVNAAPVFDCDSAQINGNWYFTTQTVTDFYPLAASNGCDSTVITPLTISNLTGSVTSDICTDGSMIINGNTYNANNTTGTEVFSNIGPNSCDSTVTINLNVVSENIDLSIVNTSPTLAANQTGGTYQWINCNDNNSFIVGETNRNFTATNSGDYAVIITIGSCSDTSACQNVLIANVNENSFKTKVLLSPNPTTGNVNVNFGKSLNNGTITVLDIMGKNVFEIRNINNESIQLDINDLSSGLYFVQVQNNGQQKTIKLIKE